MSVSVFLYTFVYARVRMYDFVSVCVRVQLKGFLGETYSVQNAPDISHFPGWRAYLAAQQKQ